MCFHFERLQFQVDFSIAHWKLVLGSLWPRSYHTTNGCFSCSRSVKWSKNGFADLHWKDLVKLCQVQYVSTGNSTPCSPEIAPGRSPWKSRSKVHHLEGEKGIGMDCSWGGGEWRSVEVRVWKGKGLTCGQNTSERKELSISHCGNILNPLCDSKSLTVITNHHGNP